MDWESKKRRMEADPEYAAKHRAAVVRRTQLWRKRHPESYTKLLKEQAAKRKNRRRDDAGYADHIRAQKRKSYARNRVVILELLSERYLSDEAYRQRKLLRAVRDYEKLCRAMESDAALYAAWRAKRRMRTARKAISEGRRYHPLFCCRYPEWATKGQRALDARSQWLAVNLSASQRAYARELAIERRKRP